VCKLFLLFHGNYVCISYRFWDIQRQRMAWPWNWGKGRSRSLKMAPFDRSLYDFLLVSRRKYSSMLHHYRVIWRLNNRDLEIWVIEPRSLKVIQTGRPTIRKREFGFYLPSTVTMAVSLSVYKIFSDGVSRDFKNWVRGCSRSMKNGAVR